MHYKFCNHEKKLLLSIIMPAYNEAKSLPSTLYKIIDVLDKAAIPSEIIIVDDHSGDNTAEIIYRMAKKDSRIKLVKNIYGQGYGFAVRRGLELFTGDAVVIVMADSSDDPKDIFKYYKKLLKGYDCVFGTRFCRKAKVINYPQYKLILNRLGNLFVQALFRLPYNDVSNAFKCYSRTTIEGMRPLVSGHFNLTVEMPLKAIVRGYRWAVVVTNWYGRPKGLSKWKLKEIGFGYFFIILHIWFEKILRRKNYDKNTLR